MSQKTIVQELAEELRLMPRPNTSLRNRLVLIVEDDAKDAEIISKQLKDLGLRVDVANNVSAAQERLIHREPYLMVFVDLLLGNEFGTKVLSLLRDRMPEIPVCIISGNITEELRQIASAYGYSVMEKSVNQAENIIQLMQRSRAAAV